jgi:hypothetical protein
MGQLMLINPRKRRATKRKATTKKRRTYRKVAVKSNPAPAIRRRRRSIRAVAKSSRRRVRRNPIGMTGIMGMLTDAAIGAGGAIAVNFVYDKLPLPATMKMGVTGQAAKAALAIGVGILGKKVIGRSAEKMAAGALTVIAYDVIRSFMPVGAPAVAGLGYISSGQSAGQIGEYVQGSNFNFATDNSNMGEYVY